MGNYGYIYKTTNKHNKKLYVGKFKGKFTPDYHGSGIALKHAILKYGEHNFSTKLICYAHTRNELNKLEKHFISLYRKRYGNKRLYNMSDGGDGGATTTGRKHTPEDRKKMRENHAGGREKGWRMSEEQKKKISLANKGNPGSFRGKKHTVETRKKISIARTGTVCSMETRIKMSVSHRGKPSGMLGKTPYNKGKTNIELYGRKRAKVISGKLSRSAKRRWRKRKINMLTGKE